MLTINFYADSDGLLSMVTQHEIAHGVSNINDIVSELSQFYSYISDDVNNSDMVFNIGDYNIRVYYHVCGVVNVHLSSDSEFGDYSCDNCSFVITPCEVVMYITRCGKRERKQLILR